jgi:hypothetical protein
MPEIRAPRCLLLIALGVVVAVPAFVVGTGPAVTDSSWQVSKTADVTATAATATAVPTVGCGASGGLLATSIPITWTAPSGATPSRYRLHWAGTAGSGDAYFATSPGSITGGLLSVLGTSTVTVFPEYGSWVSSPTSLQSRTVTTIGTLGVVVSWTCA